MSDGSDNTGQTGPTGAPGGDPDEALVRQLEDAVNTLAAKYYMLPTNQRWELLPQLNQATSKLIAAREALMRGGVQSNAALMTQIEAIKQEVDKAADNQQLLIAAGRLVGFLFKLA